MENIEVQKQIETFEKRVAFLKEWEAFLNAKISDTALGTDFERLEWKDRVYRLGSEIESKEALIAMRKKDLERVAKEKDREVNEVKANYAMFVNRLKEAEGELKEPQAKALIEGIIKRSTNPELPMQEMIMDYKIMKSILMSLPKKEAIPPAEVKLAAVQSEK